MITHTRTMIFFCFIIYNQYCCYYYCYYYYYNYYQTNKLRHDYTYPYYEFFLFIIYNYYCYYYYYYYYYNYYQTNAISSPITMYLGMLVGPYIDDIIRKIKVRYNFMLSALPHWPSDQMSDYKPWDCGFESQTGITSYSLL